METVKHLVERKRLIEQMLVEADFRKMGNIKAYKSLLENKTEKRWKKIK